MPKGRKLRWSWMGSRTLLQSLVLEDSRRIAALPGLEPLPARRAIWQLLLMTEINEVNVGAELDQNIRALAPAAVDAFDIDFVFADYATVAY